MRPSLHGPEPIASELVDLANGVETKAGDLVFLEVGPDRLDRIEFRCAGRWNTCEVYARGPEITVKFNGVVTVSARDGRFPEGRIGLQFNGGPIKFRKLLVKEL